MPKRNFSLKPRRDPLSRRDMELHAKRAKKHAKKHPDYPEYVLPGFYWPAQLTRLKALEELGGKPMKRWRISGFNHGKEVPGKCKIQMWYLTKEDRGIRW